MLFYGCCDISWSRCGVHVWFLVHNSTRLLLAKDTNRGEHSAGYPLPERRAVADLSGELTSSAAVGVVPLAIQVRGLARSHPPWSADVKLFDLRTQTMRWETNVGNGVIGLDFDRKDIEMNKLVVTVRSQAIILVAAPLTRDANERRALFVEGAFAIPHELARWTVRCSLASRGGVAD